MKSKTNKGLKIICLNRKARFNYYFNEILEAGIVLKGSLQMTIAGEERTLKESDIYVIPSNVEHGVIQRDKACQVADLFSPPREDYK